MSSQDFFVPKSAPASGPAVVSDLPAAARPSKSSKAGGAFASAMRQAIGRERVDRRADESRSASAGPHPQPGEREPGCEAERRAETKPVASGRPGYHHEDAREEAMDRETEPALPDGAETGTEVVAVEGASEETELAAEAEETGSAEGASNIILFPDPNVIIPFPVALAAGEGYRMSAEAQPGGSASGGEAGEAKIVPLPMPPPPNAAASGSSDLDRRSTSEDSEEGIDVTKLGLRPVRTGESTGNVQPVNFERKATSASDAAVPLAGESSIVPVAFQRDANDKSVTQAGIQLPAGESGESETRYGPTQLPGGVARPEDSARHPRSADDGLQTSASPQNTGKAPSGTVLAASAGVGSGPAEPAGIADARQERDMNSLMDIRQEGALQRGADAERGERAFGGGHDSSASSSFDADKSTEFSARNFGAMDWQSGRPVSRIDRSASDDAPRSVDASATVERVTNLVVREAALVRQYKSDAMAVVLRPDAETELYVHFTQRNGQIEATVRCERGDAQQLGALWPQLQESLGQQKVRLAPLQESPSNHSNFNSSTGSQTGGGNSNHSPRQSPERHSMDEWPVPASSSESRHVRGRGGSGHRRVTTSRPGWETWA